MPDVALLLIVTLHMKATSDLRIFSVLTVSLVLWLIQKWLPGQQMMFFVHQLLSFPISQSLKPSISFFDTSYLLIIWVISFAIIASRLHSSLWQGGVLRMAIFKLIGWCSGVPVVHAHDPKVMESVLRASNNKGYGLELFAACSAWAPIRSLESIDGPEWRAAHTRMKDLIRFLPHADELQRISTITLDRLLSSQRVFDAPAIVRYTLESLILYVFDRPWEPAFELFIEASWGWRKQIALKGPAGDGLKARAMDLLVSLIHSRPDLWALHGDDWRKPEFYSLIAQPLLISPSINVTDIAVSLARHPTLSIEAAIRRSHPFPVLERFLEADLHSKTLAGEAVFIPAGTQVLAFLDTKGWADCDWEWGVFGSGVRQCTGRLQAMALLRPLANAIQQQAKGNRQIEQAEIRPEAGHLYSGRNNDNTVSVRTDVWFAWYLICAVGRAWTQGSNTRKGHAV